MDCTGIECVKLTTDVLFDSIFYPRRKRIIPAGTVCQIVQDLTIDDRIIVLVKYDDLKFVVDANQFEIMEGAKNESNDI